MQFVLHDRHHDEMQERSEKCECKFIWIIVIVNPPFIHLQVNNTLSSDEL